MFQVTTKLNLVNPLLDLQDHVGEIELRGYMGEPPVAITGGFYTAIDHGDMKPFSVDELANILCPSRRDLYLRRVLGKKGKSTWGRIAGNVVEPYLAGLLAKFKDISPSRKNRSYADVRELAHQYTSDFVRGKSQKKSIGKLIEYKTTPEENENWLISSLECASRHELAMLVTHSLLKRGGKDPQLRLHPVKIQPESKILGISSPATPDFLMEDYRVVGDVKSGREFKDFYPLTCAGYALAYENQHGKGHEIDFGIIYFFPTRSRSISFAHTYIFGIDDNLRAEFLDRRDEVFRTLLRSRSGEEPEFADRERHCIYCKYGEECDEERNKRGRKN